LRGAGGDRATNAFDRSRQHLVSLQCSIDYSNAARAVMNAADATHPPQGIGARHDNGINAFIEVTSRASFAVPARAQRAYPHHQERTQT